MTEQCTTTNEQRSDAYRNSHRPGRQGCEFKEWCAFGSTEIPVLNFLIGHPWDDFALAYVHALRPSHVRVIDFGYGVQMDAQPWRVTICLDKSELIESITQEVEVGLPDGVDYGEELNAYFHGKERP